MSQKLQTFLIILGFIVFLTGGFLAGRYLFPKTVTVTQPVSNFAGKPDSTKVTIITQQISGFPAMPKQSKPDSTKDNPATPVKPSQAALDNAGDTTKPQTKKYTSYKTFIDPMCKIVIWSVSESPVDTLGAQVTHFKMKEVSIPDVWTYFKWGGILGATVILVVEFIFHKWIK
jgi:hypothetical protein